MFNKTRQRGFTLVEMIIALVVLSFGVTGVLMAFTSSVRGSADALIAKQLVAVAEGMMEEILLKPYSLQPGAGASGGVLACGGAAGRGSFDDVRDYNGYQTSSVCEIDGTSVAGLAGYAVAVTVSAPADFSGAANSLFIRVTVTRGTQTMVLDGIRTNYAGV